MSTSPTPPGGQQPSSDTDRIQDVQHELDKLEREGLVRATTHGGKRIHELTAAGRQLWAMLLEASSHHAGRNVSGDDISKAMQLTRVELRCQELDLRDPNVQETFMRHLSGPPN